MGFGTIIKKFIEPEGRGYLGRWVPPICLVQKFYTARPATLHEPDGSVEVAPRIVAIKHLLKADRLEEAATLR